MDGSVFNEDYFERGIETGTSCYQRYHWMPELTLKLAYNYIKYLGIKDTDMVCDFGASKGYIIRALRLLDINAYGCDISEYAINNCDVTVKDYLKLSTTNNIIPFDTVFDFIIAKDVFEHIPESEIDNVITAIYEHSTNLFAIIPLGINNKFEIPAYALDKTHVLAKDVTWWFNKFEQNGWKLKSFSYYVPGIKESWAQYDVGNGFFWLNKG